MLHFSVMDDAHCDRKNPKFEVFDVFGPREISALLALLPSLAPGEDAGEALVWFHEHREGCRDLVREVPGFDQLRAGVVRILPAAVPDLQERSQWLNDAAAALDAYEPETLDAASRLRRHPAWVALCLLECGEQLDWDVHDTVLRSVGLARRGFSALPGRPPADTGEIMWAIAEAAAEVGWVDHAHPMLERAVTERFADADNLARVRLLRILARLERDEHDGIDGMLQEILDGASVDDQTLVHTLWIGAHLDQAAGRIPRALERLHRALEHVEEHEDDVAERIRGLIQALGGNAETSAEA